jgi:3,4-dihydroxy-2-butanone 4-phosphate synthase/GTP cyclohydrolase II
MENSRFERLRRIASARMPTKWDAAFQVLGFERDLASGAQRVETALAIVLGDLSDGVPLVRLHSQCFTSEALWSLRCDCSDQLDIAMRAIAAEGRGLVIYEHQEGRGIGLMAKLQAYALQDAGLDTVEANHALGFSDDCRTFSLSVAILVSLGVKRVRLLTNNPRKHRALIQAGIEVVERLRCEAQPTQHSLAYLRTKKERMGHSLRFEQNQAADTMKVPLDGLSGQAAIADGLARDRFAFSTIETAIRELRAGRMIVVVDDEDRENEGDLTMAAEMVTPEAVNFMAMHGRGLICLAMTGERLDQLALGPMVQDNTAWGGTAFSVSIDLKGHGVTTGISAHDRARTIRAATDPNTAPEDFGRPGHVFPLRASDSGVLERRGQTEAAVDLARLAGLHPAGVICEVVNDDGTMARVPELARLCGRHGLALITVADLARYRLEHDREGSLEAIDGLFPVNPG